MPSGLRDKIPAMKMQTVVIGLLSVAVLLLAYIALTVHGQSSVIWLAPQEATSTVPHQIPAATAAPATDSQKPSPVTVAAASTPVPIPQPAPPRVVTFALMPEQSMDLPNTKFQRVEIHSQFPLQIMSGHCQQNYGVEFVCADGEPADIFVRDVRVRPIFKTPQGNLVTLTGWATNPY